MGAIVEAIDLVAGYPPSTPISLGVSPGEIVGLLFPPAIPRAPILRALAGVDAALAGEVRLLRHGRIRIATSETPLSAVLSSRPDLVLLDAAERLLCDVRRAKNDVDVLLGHAEGDDSAVNSVASSAPDDALLALGRYVLLQKHE